MRYDQGAFRHRKLCLDAHILVLREQSEPIACCLSFHDPSFPRHTITIDSVTVMPELEGRGIGRF
jgi:hypothetical protein